MATAGIILLVLCLIESGDLPVNRWGNLYVQAGQQFNRGNFESAREAAGLGYRYWQRTPGARWYWPFRLILAESLIEQDRMAEAMPLLEGSAPNAAWEARRLVGIAFIKFRERNNDGARHALDSAEAINPSESRDVAGKIDLIRGMIHLRQEQPLEAEVCFRRALEAVGGSGSLVESYTLTDLAVGDLRSFRTDEAVVWLERARAMAQSSGMKAAVMLADSNLGVCFQQLGDLDRALAYLKEAASIAGSLGDRVNQVWILVTAGETAFELGDSVKPEEYLEKAERLASPAKDDEWLTMIFSDRSTIAQARGDLAEAERWNRKAAEVAERLTSPRPRLAQRIQAAEIAAARREYPAAEKLFLDARDVAQQLRDQFFLWQCHAGLASVYRRVGRISQTAQEYRIAIGIIQSETSKLTQEEFKLSFLSHLISFYRDYVDFLIDRGDKTAAFRVVQSCRARLLVEKAHRAASQEPAGETKTLERSLQASGSILLSYWLAPQRSFLWVLDGAKLQVFTLPPEAEIASRVRQYTDSIMSGANPLESRNTAGRWLFSNIVPAAYRAPKAGNIVIQPDGALHQLNFESLPAEDGSRFWIEEATVSIAPSLALLREAAGVQQSRLLLFGVPESAAGDLPRLPNLRAEIDAVAANYSDKMLYTGTAATPASYRSSHPETFSTLHFAAHAESNRESPLDSAIILAGPADSRKLYARDILAQPLTAEVVTLSACQTAGSRTYYGEGLVGFSWAFLSTGARNVVAGLWPVDDRATAGLMKRFYQSIAAGRPPAVALRQAKLDLMASGAIYRKPRYWAAFETFTRALYHPSARR